MGLAKILVVDDEVELKHLIRRRFRKRIRSQEMDFVFASNAVEALHTLQRDAQIDMVLTDINMPEMDGLTFIHHLPRISETLKAVVISAYNDMTRVRQAMNGGAFDFITKPIDFQDLEQTIEKTLKVVRQLKDKQRQIQQVQEELRQAAFHDNLTGLPNRNWLYGHLNHLLHQREPSSDKCMALLFVDLNGFKQINDRLGHLSGDILLKSVAQRLRLCLREGDFAARLGGDEFVIVVEGMRDAIDAAAIAERIQLQLAHPFPLDSIEVRIGASIGITLGSKNDYQSPEDLLRAADLAMYAAKAQGKDCYMFYDRSI